MKKDITVTDLAKIAQVSRATVSRVLNGNACVNPEARERVLAAVSETGYQKSGTNKVRYELTFKEVTLLSDEEDIQTPNTFFSNILQHLKDEADRLSLKVSFIFRHTHSSEEAFASNLQQAEAVILVGNDNPSMLQAVQKQHLPAIILNGVDEHMQVPSVSPDNEFSAFQMTSYLLDKGHRHIKYVTADIKHAMCERTDGFIRALRMHGIKFDRVEHVVDICEVADKVDPTGALRERIEGRRGGVDFGLQYVLPWLMEHKVFEGTTAVMCVCDMTALTLIEGFKAQGLRVPEDISVTGFDDVMFSSLVTPGLTTVRPDFKNMARIALRLLIQHAGDDSLLPMRICCSTQLIERASVKTLQKK